MGACGSGEGGVSGEGVRGRHLHLDCVSGIAGDMTLGALIDLGVPVEAVGAALEQVGIARGRLRVVRVVRGGIAAVDVKVETGAGFGDGFGVLRLRPSASQGPGLRMHGTPAPPTVPHDHDHGGEHVHEHGHDHGHGGDHGHDHAHGGDHVHEHGHDHDHGDAHGHDAHEHDGHGHHHYAAIRARIVGGRLADDVRVRALDLFDRVARAEAKLHGMSIEDVVFHEVGAIDSIVDLVGTAAALAWLAPVSVTCAEVAMGHGTIRCAHGVLPVPAPAALEILREAGGIMTSGGLARELTTPTGAAILAHAVTAWTPAPAGRALAVGWGAGDAEFADRANVVRVTAMEPRPRAGAGDDDGLWRLEANLDDMSPELAGHTIDQVLAAGAVDAWWTPITMKKGRPALVFAALVPAPARDRVVAAILRETTTIGVRFDRVERTVLARELVVVDTEHGPLPIKVARDPAGAIVNAAPEHDACAAVAARTGAPLKDVYAAAIAAWHTSAARHDRGPGPDLPEDVPSVTGAERS